MRVFVVGIGRCGTMTFAEACRHINNYTSGHETRALKPACFDYPDRHIEIDGRLSRCIFALVDRYPDAVYFHLIRDRAASVESLTNWGIAHQFARWVWGGTRVITDQRGQRRRTCGDMDRATARKVADVLWVHGNGAIKAALPADSMTIQLERISEQWPEFWRRIGATGAFTASLLTLGNRFNAGRPETNIWNPACLHKPMKIEPL